MSLLEVIILAIIEGITEFLPVSSTGHMVIVSAMMGINEQTFTKIFTINIQLGAILAVVFLYRKRFFQSFNFYLKLFLGFLPVAIVGLLLHDWIDGLLERVWVIAVSLILGGIVFLKVDSWFNNVGVEEKPISLKAAIRIGLFQCIALIPGVSRSAATIIGGMIEKLDRKEAAEFSFFLGVPTIFAASAYKFLKNYQYIQPAEIKLLAIGNIIAFIVAILAIKFFIRFLTVYGFKVFGYYRIILGITLLILLALGIDVKIL